MDAPAVSHVEVSGNPCRVWSKGSGRRIGFLAGFGGLPKWIPFLDALATENEVVVPSIPGFPGALGHTSFDSHIDWVLAIRDLLKQSGLLDGAPLIGSGPGVSLAAEMAAFSPGAIDRLSGLAKRLGHIACPTLLIRGEGDQVIPANYMEAFRAGTGGETTIEAIANAGHLAELDQPQAVADAIRAFI